MTFVVSFVGEGGREPHVVLDELCIVMINYVVVNKVLVICYSFVFVLDDVVNKSTCIIRNVSFVFAMSCILQHPFTAVVAGPTGSGKSQFVLRLIDNASEMIEPPPTRIWYLSLIHISEPMVRSCP